MIEINEDWYEENYMEMRSQNFLQGFHPYSDQENYSKKEYGGFMPMLFNHEIQERHLEEFLKQDLYTNSIFRIVNCTVGNRWQRPGQFYYLFQELPWNKYTWYIYSLKLITTEDPA